MLASPVLPRAGAIYCTRAGMFPFRSGLVPCTLGYRNLALSSCLQQKSAPKKPVSDLDIQRERPFAELTLGEKVKQTGKDATNIVLILAGVGAAGMLFYVLGSELFSSKSSNSVYSKAVNRVASDDDVLVALGGPIKAHGETSSRGRRRRVSHVVFKRGDRNCMRMQFYVKGSSRQGTVHLEVMENESGQYEYRYLFVELDSGRRILLERADDR